MAPTFRTALLTALFGVVALVVGLRGLTVAFIGSLLVLVAMAMAYLWNRFVFSRLTVERAINRKHAEFDAPLTMQLGLTNRKLLPIFGLKVEHHVGPGLKIGEPRNLQVIKHGAYNIFQDSFQLNWYEKRGRTYDLVPERRGRFEFGSGSLSYSDPFGFFASHLEGVFPDHQLVVFPRVVPIKGIASLNTFLFGTRPKEGWIFTDPLNRIGTRPYQSTDSARLINWKASARHVETQVHVEKPSFDQEVYLVLEQPPDLAWWTQQVSNTLEVAIMAAASLVHSYSQSGYEIVLLTNLVSQVHGVASAPQSARRGRAERNQLLTNLALLQGFSVEPIQKILTRAKGQFKPGSTIVVLTTAPGELDPVFSQALRKLSQGSRVALVRVLPDSASGSPADGIKQWRLEGGRPWHELAALELF